MSADPIKALQRAARLAATYVSPNQSPKTVIVLDSNGDRILALPLPPCACEPPPEAKRAELAPAVVPGWEVTDKAARFDGTPVPIPGSRLPILRALVDAAAPMTGKELARAAFGEHGDEEQARFHVKKLREELRAAFGYEGDPVPNGERGEKSGYYLALR